MYEVPLNLFIISFLSIYGPLVGALVTIGTLRVLVELEAVALYIGISVLVISKLKVVFPFLFDGAPQLKVSDVVLLVILDVVVDARAAAVRVFFVTVPEYIVAEVAPYLS